MAFLNWSCAKPNIKRQIIFYAKSIEISTDAIAHVRTYQRGGNIINGTNIKHYNSTEVLNIRSDRW